MHLLVITLIIAGGIGVSAYGLETDSYSEIEYITESPKTVYVEVDYLSYTNHPEIDCFMDNRHCMYPVIAINVGDKIIFSNAGESLTVIVKTIEQNCVENLISIAPGGSAEKYFEDISLFEVNTRPHLLDGLIYVNGTDTSNYAPRCP